MKCSGSSRRLPCTSNGSDAQRFGQSLEARENELSERLAGLEEAFELRAVLVAARAHARRVERREGEVGGATHAAGADLLETHPDTEGIFAAEEQIACDVERAGALFARGSEHRVERAEVAVDVGHEGHGAAHGLGGTVVGGGHGGALYPNCAGGATGDALTSP